MAKKYRRPLISLAEYDASLGRVSLREITRIERTIKDVSNLLVEIITAAGEPNARERVPVLASAAKTLIESLGVRHG